MSKSAILFKPKLLPNTPKGGFLSRYESGTANSLKLDKLLAEQIAVVRKPPVSKK